MLIWCNPELHLTKIPNSVAVNNKQLSKQYTADVKKLVQSVKYVKISMELCKFKQNHHNSVHVYVNILCVSQLLNVSKLNVILFVCLFVVLLFLTE